MTDTKEMFQELVAAKIIGYGGGNGKSPSSYSAGVSYSELFAKCYSGVQTIDSFDDLENLYLRWLAAGRHWDGVVMWLSVKHGYLPLFFYVEAIEAHGRVDFSTLGLPEHPDNPYYRSLLASIRNP